MTSDRQDFTVSAERRHFDYLAEGRLRLQHCEDCSKAVFYPRSICPHCGEARLVWQDSPGRGTVYSVTLVRMPPDKGGNYNVALIDLEEGVRMMSRVEGMAPEAVQIGQRVVARISQTPANHPLLTFIPVHDHD